MLDITAWIVFVINTTSAESIILSSSESLGRLLYWVLNDPLDELLSTIDGEFSPFFIYDPVIFPDGLDIDYKVEPTVWKLYSYG